MNNQQIIQHISDELSLQLGVGNVSERLALIYKLWPIMAIHMLHSPSSEEKIATQLQELSDDTDTVYEIIKETCKYFVGEDNDHILIRSAESINYSRGENIVVRLSQLQREQTKLLQELQDILEPFSTR